MKFAHLADCHIGGWRDPNLKELTIECFEKAIDISIENEVDFVLIAGDLFDTALPNVDQLKRTTKALQYLRELDIPVYAIAGSHDYSPSGKTMLDVLENAKLLKNVSKNPYKFTIDKKTGTKITGLGGKRSSLEINDFKELDKPLLESEPGFKIFMFHTAVEELRPIDLEAMQAISLNDFPKGFNYYAGGHVHIVLEKDADIGKVIFPGPGFPNNFRELEKLKKGSFYIVEKAGDTLLTNKIELNLKEVLSYSFDATNKTPDEIDSEILTTIKDFHNKIVTIRIKGELESGKPSDISFRKIYSNLDDAYTILRNTSKLRSKEFEVLHVDLEESLGVEDAILKEYKDKQGADEFLIKKLMDTLNKEKQDGEKTGDFEARILQEAITLLNLENDN